VVPDLHDHLGGPETGEISRRVAVVLYEIGVWALAFSWLGLITDRGLRSGWQGLTRLGLLTANTGLLIALILMHQALGIRLDGGERLSTFRDSHEQYLMVWSGQWLAILGLMALDVYSRLPRKGGQSSPGSEEFKIDGRS
jgi:hypothetical protein